jgi:hypothetical protein
MQGRPIEVTKETVPKDCQTAGEKNVLETCI